MFEVKFLNSALFLLIKYSLFFLLLAFIGDRFQHTVLDKAETSIEVVKLTVGYMVFVLLASVFLIALFAFPLYFVLRLNGGAWFLLGITVFYATEYIAYSYFYSPSDRILGIYNMGIGIVLFPFFFGRSIRNKFS